MFLYLVVSLQAGPIFLVVLVCMPATVSSKWLAYDVANSIFIFWFLYTNSSFKLV